MKVIQAAVLQGETLLLTQKIRFTLDLSATDVSFTTRARIKRETADLTQIYLFIWLFSFRQAHLFLHWWTTPKTRQGTLVWLYSAGFQWLGAITVICLHLFLAVGTSHVSLWGDCWLLYTLRFFVLAVLHKRRALICVLDCSIMALCMAKVGGRLNQVKLSFLGCFTFWSWACGYF